MTRSLLGVVAVVVTMAGCAEEPAPLSDTASPQSGQSESVSTAPAVVDETAPVTTAVDSAGAAAAEAVALVVVDPTVRTVVDAARAIEATGDPSWIPHLIDLLRLGGTGDPFTATQRALETLTGVTAPTAIEEAYAFYGSVMYREAITPAPGYIDWKAAAYALIDDDFGTFIGAIDDPVIAARVQWGGVLRNGIPALEHQSTVSVAEADYMQPDELTFGAVVNGQPRSYPHRILDHHELANDSLGGEPVALANCTLCRTGVLFSRRVSDQVLDFQTSGLLLSSNKIMVDTQTESLWNQLTGEAFAGPLQGTQLDRFPITVTTWEQWVTEHPSTDVVAIPSPSRYSYQPGDAYRSYYEGDRLWFPTFDYPDHLDAKAEMGTIELSGEQLAVSIEALAKSGPLVFHISGVPVAALPTDGGVRFYRLPAGDVDLGGAIAGEESLVTLSGDAYQRLVSGHSFWFAWFGNHPDTAVWPEA